MKELSIKEKAKRYDEAIEKFDVILNLNTVKESGTIFADDVRKILPELAESEDERIRKAIHIYLDWLDGRNKDYHPKGVYTIKDMIAWLEKQATPQVRTGIEWVNTIDDACDERYAEEYSHGEYCHEQSFKWGFQEGVEWLEKQGEHANFRNKIEIGDKVTRNEDGVLVNLSQLARVAKPAKNQDVQQETLCGKCRKEQPSHSCQDITALGRCAVEHEQKPAEFDDANAKRMFIKALERVEEQNNKGYKLTDCDKNSWWEDFKAYCGYTEIQKSVWSEEDEEIYRKCICAMRASACGFPEEEKFVEQVDSWLKSLKERVQPKQQWSKEDERIKNNLLSELTNLSVRKLIEKETENKYVNWLKSLRPQNTWKPSDEQIYELTKAIDYYTSHGFPNKILNELLKLLKNL